MQGVSTLEAYKALTLPSSEDVLTRVAHLDTLKIKLEKGRPISEWEGLLFNRLEEPVLKRHPRVRQAKNILRRSGLKGALMSGSGASVFGFAGSHEEAQKAANRLKGYPWKVFTTCCLG